MFVYDNKKVSVYCANRCGNTSMYSYFGIPKYTLPNATPDIWYNTNSTKVVVLRNPVERMYSACNLFKIINLRGEAGKNFYVHCAPYLHDIQQNWDFKVIDFYKLSNYIPISNDTIPTASGKITTGEYIVNEFFTEAELFQECFLYETLMKTKEEITPEEWKELTQ